MRRNTLCLFVGAVTILASACRDAVVQPNRTNSLSETSSPSFSRANGAPHDRTVLGTLDLSPRGGVYHVGDFDVLIPAGAVCDPRTTKYGARYWDDDCTPATSSVTVNVVAETKHGQVSVDFQPDLRFRPSAGWVVIQTAAYGSILKDDGVRQLSTASPFFNQFSILYVPTGKAAHIDEVQSTGDASMVTHVDLSSGLVWRRVKHFSGYLIASGDKCTTGTDAACPITDDPTTGATGTASTLGTVLDSVPVILTIGSVLVTP